MGQIGKPQRIHKIPKPARVPQRQPVPAPIKVPQPEPEKPKVPANR